VVGGKFPLGPLCRGEARINRKPFLSHGQCPCGAEDRCESGQERTRRGKWGLLIQTPPDHNRPMGLLWRQGRINGLPFPPLENVRTLFDLIGSSRVPGRIGSPVRRKLRGASHVWRLTKENGLWVAVDCVVVGSVLGRSWRSDGTSVARNR